MRRQTCGVCKGAIPDNEPGDGSGHTALCAEVVRVRSDRLAHNLGAIRRVIAEWSGAHSEAVEVLSRIQTLSRHVDHEDYDPTCPLCTKPKTA